jgi:hypothetical protein
LENYGWRFGKKTVEDYGRGTLGAVGIQRAMICVFLFRPMAEAVPRGLVAQKFNREEVK